MKHKNQRAKPDILPPRLMSEAFQDYADRLEREMEKCDIGRSNPVDIDQMADALAVAKAGLDSARREEDRFSVLISTLQLVRLTMMKGDNAHAVEYMTLAFSEVLAHGHGYDFEKIGETFGMMGKVRQQQLAMENAGKAVAK